MDESLARLRAIITVIIASRWGVSLGCIPRQCHAHSENLVRYQVLPHQKKKRREEERERTSD